MKGSTDLVDGQRQVAMQFLCEQELRIADLEREPTSRAATCPGSGDAGLRPLLNQSTLKLSQRGEDVEDQLPGDARSRRTLSSVSTSVYDSRC